MRVTLLLNIGDEDKPKYGLEDEPAMEDDVVDLKPEHAEALKVKGWAEDVKVTEEKHKKAEEAKKAAEAKAASRKITEPKVK